MTCMINLSGRAINAQKFQDTFRSAIPGSPTCIVKRGGVGFPITAESLVKLDQQIGPVMRYLDSRAEDVKKMLRFPGVEGGSLDFGVRIDLDKIIFNLNNHLPLTLLRLATEIGLSIEMSFYFDFDMMTQNAPSMKVPQVECSLTFLPPEEGGRIKPPAILTGGTYRPHLVVDDPRLRKSIVVDGNRIPETYLGVAFHKGPKDSRAGVPINAVLDLIYYPQIMYENLQPGVLFTVREGSQIVAYGTVMRRLH